MLDEQYTFISGKSRYNLLCLKANSELTVHLSETPIESDIKVRNLIKNMEDTSYVLMVNGANGRQSAQQRIKVDSCHIESAIEMKYNPLSIPSQTTLIIWDFWSISYQIIFDLLKRPWRKVDVFAVYFDWSALTEM